MQHGGDPTVTLGRCPLSLLTTVTSTQHRVSPRADVQCASIDQLYEDRVGETIEGDCIWLSKVLSALMFWDSMALWQMQKEFHWSQLRGLRLPGSDRRRQCREGQEKQCRAAGVKGAGVENSAVSPNSIPEIKIQIRKWGCHIQWPQRVTKGQRNSWGCPAVLFCCMSVNKGDGQEIHSSRFWFRILLMRRLFVSLKSFCVSDQSHQWKVLIEGVPHPYPQKRKKAEFTQPYEDSGRTKC